MFFTILIFALCFTALLCFVFYLIFLNCIVFFCILLYFNLLYCILLYCIFHPSYNKANTMQVKMPVRLVELRHECTHGEMATVQELRCAAVKALMYLKVVG